MGGGDLVIEIPFPMAVVTGGLRIDHNPTQMENCKVY